MTNNYIEFQMVVGSPGRNGEGLMGEGGAVVFVDQDDDVTEFEDCRRSQSHVDGRVDGAVTKVELVVESHDSAMDGEIFKDDTDRGIDILKAVEDQMTALGIGTLDDQRHKSRISGWSQLKISRHGVRTRRQLQDEGAPVIRSISVDRRLRNVSEFLSCILDLTIGGPELLIIKDGPVLSDTGRVSIDNDDASTMCSRHHDFSPDEKTFFLT